MKNSILKAPAHLHPDTQAWRGHVHANWRLEQHHTRLLTWRLRRDGEKWHGPDRWWADYKRQVTLERMGWTFWRCWGSDWRLDRAACLSDLHSVLGAMGILPGQTPYASHEY